MSNKHTMIVFLLIILASAGDGWAETCSFTFQRGLDGYDGVEDVFLYAPDSVANVNFGGHPNLSAGLNRWNERQVSLIRFDLSALPATARILKVTLCLFDMTKEWPNAELQVDIYQVAAENAQWIEGENVETRDPIPGTCCWNYLAYNNRPWAGTAGLATEATDYEVPAIGSLVIPVEHDGWVEFDLQPDAVQKWVGRREGNPGWKIDAPFADKAGLCVAFRSSQTNEHHSTGPKLVLEVEMGEEAVLEFRHETARRAVNGALAAHAALLDARTAGGKDVSPRLRRTVGDIQKRLLKAQRAVNSTKQVPERKLRSLLKDLDRLQERLATLPDEFTIAQAAAANKAMRLKSDFALGVADSMTNVVREPRYLQAAFTDAAQISMAQNEFEALQIVLVPVDKEIKDATWSVTDLQGELGSRIPSSDVSIQVMGYMKSIKPAITSDVKWWPVPILDFMTSVDVMRGEVQPLWVCVRTREDTPPGKYTGTLTVSAEKCQQKKVLLEVNVWDFAVPKEQNLLTFCGNNEAAAKRLYGERYDKDMAREMFSFLLDHRLAVNTLYAHQAAGEPQAEAFIGYPTFSNPSELRRVWDASSRWWNLGYLHPVFAQRAGKPIDEYLPSFIEMLKESLRVADAAEWHRDNMTIYLFDETSDFETLNRMAERIKEVFPDIPLMTTGYDRSYGVKGGPIDKSIDIWCPLTSVYVEDLEVIQKARELGKKAWWYVCCVPRGSKDLNFFCQLPAIRSRLLMGAAAWKYKPDGFLYYNISGWNHYEKPIDSGPLTDWKPYFLPGPDGDGLLICPGPNGPLSTLQFENIRDGIEDYEYFWVLNDLVDRAKQTGLSVENEEALLEVPGDWLSTITVYSEEPARLRVQRELVAEAIVRLKKRLGESATRMN